MSCLRCGALAVIVQLSVATPVPGQETAVSLVVAAGRPIRVSLDARLRLHGVGQAVVATLIEPVYAYDRVVVPQGAKVLGHVEALEAVSKGVRWRAMLGGDFTPLRHARLRFDMLVLDDGTHLPIDTRVTWTASRVEPAVAGEHQRSGRGRVRDAVERRAEEAVDEIAQPHKMARLRDAAIGRLPYHPQYLRQGSVYTLELQSSLNFGSTTPLPWAPDAQHPSGPGVLDATLVTALDSRTTPRGTPMRAVLSAPLLSADRKLILPEGTELRGQVTLATAARHWRRNGQMRFLIDSVTLPAQGATTLMASLHSTSLSADDHARIDDEGGLTLANPKTRFVAPALALLAAHAAFGLDPIDAGEIGNATAIPGANVGGRAAGGLMGLGLVGMAVAQVSRPVAGVLGIVGAVQAVYASIVGRGRDVVFAAGTPMQLELSPVAVAPPD